MPGMNCRPMSAASVTNPSTHQTTGARLNRRIASSYQAKARLAKTARGGPGVKEGRGRSTNRRTAGRSLDRRFAEIRRANFRVRQQLPRFAGQGDLSALHDVAACTDLERELGVLLDEKNGHAFAGNGKHGLENLLHHQWRESHRRIVEKQ